ncbi:MAG: IS66 family insertion sequence element accessory protein TnpB [Clostridiaceae bacterium]|nr:IS66 family insertion sequence element accessory protein TnpB [Clostridiaceae bacterium]
MKAYMRKSINGLCEIVMNNFDIDSREKILFGFCNRQRNRVKILVWDDNGFWIHFNKTMA